MKRLLLLVFLLSAPALAALPLVQAKAEPGTADEFAGCSLACGIQWETRVSSELPPQEGNRYGVACAEDADGRTCWASKGKGEWIEFRFTDPLEEGSSRGAVPMRGIRFVNGYAKSKEAWKNNARVKTLEMAINGRPVRRIRLLDRPGVQAATFADTPVKPGDVVRLTILDTYPGAKFPDTCLSEVVLDGAH